MSYTPLLFTPRQTVQPGGKAVSYRIEKRCSHYHKIKNNP